MRGIYEGGNAVVIHGDVINAAYQAGTGISITNSIITGAYKGENGVSVKNDVIRGEYIGDGCIGGIPDCISTGCGISVAGNVISLNKKTLDIYRSGWGIKIDARGTIHGDYKEGTRIKIEGDENSLGLVPGPGILICDGQISIDPDLIECCLDSVVSALGGPPTQGLTDPLDITTTGGLSEDICGIRCILLTYEIPAPFMAELVSEDDMHHNPPLEFGYEITEPERVTSVVVNVIPGDTEFATGCIDTGWDCLINSLFENWEITFDNYTQTDGSQFTHDPIDRVPLDSHDGSASMFSSADFYINNTYIYETPDGLWHRAKAPATVEIYIRYD
jgi:hypothetical protein